MQKASVPCPFRLEVMSTWVVQLCDISIRKEVAAIRSSDGLTEFLIQDEWAILPGMSGRGILLTKLQDRWDATHLEIERRTPTGWEPIQEWHELVSKAPR